MPCSTITPTKSYKRKIRFDDIVFIDEVVIDTPLVDYRYASKEIRKRAPRPVIRDPNTMYAKDLMSQAVARFRAIELANGRGLVNDPADTELWMGVESVHPMES
eukprot:9399565-Heterocapsa_arctica.AAC.1